jgi:hypothetical protein
LNGASACTAIAHMNPSNSREPRYDLIVVFTARHHRREAFMQSFLCLPRDLLGFVAQR